MEKKSQASVQQLVAQSASFCFKDGRLTGLLLSSNARKIEDVIIKNKDVYFGGYDSLDEQFSNESRKICFVATTHPQYDKIVEVLRAKGVITNDKA